MSRFADPLSVELCETGGVRQWIRFSATPAGRVAYSVMGNGPVLLCDTGWVSHLEKMLEMESVRAFFAALAERFSVVRYDKAGSGLSDRTGVDLSFNGQVSALLAIADQLESERFHLFGASQGGQVAAAVAALHRKRTDRLVLYGMCARGSDLAPADVRASLVSLVRAHWGLGSQALAGIFLPDPTPDDVREFAKWQRSAASSDIAAELLAEYYGTDVSLLLPNIEAPTLVLHREHDRATGFHLGREVASLIPKATFIPLHGRAHLFWKGEWEQILESLLDFLDEPTTATPVSLSPRELEVASLVAEGLTNQEIARRLFIAPRTAETHLENIRQKLGFRSRAQVATWVTARRQGRDPDARVRS